MLECLGFMKRLNSKWFVSEQRLIPELTEAFWSMKLSTQGTDLLQILRTDGQLSLWHGHIPTPRHRQFGINYAVI